ncbi:MAG: alpha-glucosidase/alpha-galactosidase [Kiritimatiellaeota bacterium]|nr:alpha-glucosidase/alpha-galactosidase [Kiritimatiellota bacterium]
MSFKIACVGAGSLGFTRTLMHDLLAVPEFQGITIALTDISPKNLSMITKILERDIRANKLPAKIESTTDRRKAFTDAKYIINSTRIGGLEAFATDIEIPLKYGVDQCVGDTLCAGGIMYGQRGIEAMRGFCEDVNDVAAPDALMLNYGNPNAMLTWAANEYFGVDCIGLCHGVQGGHWQLSDLIQRVVNGKKKEGDKGFRKVTMKDVDIICAGINHQTWYVQVIFDGVDWANERREELIAAFESHPDYCKTERVRIDIMKRFGYYSTESNGHLSEYVPWYRKRKGETVNWIDMGSWINGETGGYLRVCAEGRNWFETEFPKILAEAPWSLEKHHRSHEHGSYIIEGLETGRPYRGHFNVVNGDTLTNLPKDAIVEVPCWVDRNGVSVPAIGELPLACAAICSTSINVQRLAVLAAIEGDVELLKQAMLLDPLTSAVCTTPEISQMTDEMLIAQAKWLPQYKGSLAATKKRFASEKKLGTWTWEGVGRKQLATATAVTKRNAATAAKRKAGKKLDIAEPEG